MSAPTSIDQARAITTVCSFALGMLAVAVIAQHRLNARLVREARVDRCPPAPPEPMPAPVPAS